MATLYITEVSALGYDMTLGTVPAPRVPALAEQAVPITGASVQSNPFNVSTSIILVNTDSACSLAFGPNPLAQITAHRLGANETRFYSVIPGQCLAVIANM